MRCLSRRVCDLCAGVRGVVGHQSVAGEVVRTKHAKGRTVPTNRVRLFRVFSAARRDDIKQTNQLWKMK